LSNAYKKYCPDVWKSVFVSKLDQERVSMGFCCQNSENVTVDISTVTKSTWQNILQQKRQDFIQTVDSSQCQNCWQIENSQGISRRINDINWFDNNDMVQDQKLQLNSLEWNCENLCNLACITCGPLYSSRWATEIKRYPWTDANQYFVANKNKFYQTLDLSYLRRVYFNGGEPLLTNDHIEILTKLQQENTLQHCEVSYNTNGTIIPNDLCLSLWKEAKLVRVMLSIDAIDKNFEFVRWPAKWEQITTFINTLKSQPFNIIIDITCTVGIHNVFSLDKLYNWHTKECKVNHQGDPVSLNVQSCAAFSHGGKVLNLGKISKKLATNAIEYLSDLTTIPNVSLLIHLCRTSNYHDQDWLSYLDSLSDARNKDWKIYLPELDHQYNKML
jgi:uncharacterized radical SAM superfamily Fe-S cluster-containing enzyme